MSLLRFFKPKDGLPDPRGTLSTSLTYAAIAQANQEVQKATSSVKQCGPYKKYSAGLRAEIGKYASYQTTDVGVAASSLHFSRQLSKDVSEMTVRSIQISVSGVLHQQLLPISRGKRGSHEYSRLFGGRVRSRLTSRTCIIADR